MPLLLSPRALGDKLKDQHWPEKAPHFPGSMEGVPVAPQKEDQLLIPGGMHLLNDSSTALNSR